MKRYTLEIIAFFGGALSMILELVGSRLVSPYLGNSIFVWTSLIGTILLSLSIGYFIGGKLADQKPELSELSYLLLLASIFSTTILIFEYFIPFILLIPLGIRLITVVVSLLLFTPTTIVLGMITPLVARIKINSVTQSGSAIGTLYSLSTIGSIIGTFLGGFVLISFIGTTAIMIGVSAFLFILYLFSLISYKHPEIHVRLIIIFAVLFISQIIISHIHRNVIADIDSSYNRWLVQDHVNPETHQTVRYLKNNVFGIQSALAMDNKTALYTEYLKVFDQAETLHPGYKSALLIGAGAYTYPYHFAATYPDKKLDIVEIDGSLKTIAEKYFAYPTSTNIRSFEEDGRIYLNTNTQKYDVILVDAFSSALSIPHHLTTREAIQKIHSSLNPHGLVMVNIISPLAGTKTDFLIAETLTYQSVFKHVTLTQVDTSRPKEALQNVSLVASDDPINFGSELSTTPEHAQSKILTDDFAPIERYTESMLEETYKSVIH